MFYGREYLGGLANRQVYSRMFIMREACVILLSILYNDESKRTEVYDLGG